MDNEEIMKLEESMKCIHDMKVLFDKLWPIVAKNCLYDTVWSFSIIDPNLSLVEFEIRYKIERLQKKLKEKVSEVSA